MFKIPMLFVVFFLFLPIVCVADMPPDKLIAAMETVEERSGDTYAIRDVPDEPLQYGCLQITEICLKDYNRIYKTNYKIEQILGDRELSIEICRGYIDYWATEKRVGRKVTLEDMARIWNGGPRGFKWGSTDSYWMEVKKELDLIKEYPVKRLEISSLTFFCCPKPIFLVLFCYCLQECECSSVGLVYKSIIIYLCVLCECSSVGRAFR